MQKPHALAEAVNLLKSKLNARADVTYKVLIMKLAAISIEKKR